ncbi:hypothetical protein [Nonomuraea glycinis]|uniref:hypothetical protein n=1 Tax=Nonomuraea glycinis TaxID=2047744 RepID=UPI0033A6380B
MIFKRVALIAGLLGGAVFGSPQALAEDNVGQPSPAQLRAALLQPADLGSDFVRRKIRYRKPLLDRDYVHTKACAQAVNRVAPLYRSKTATWIVRGELAEGINQFIVSGTASRTAALERAAKVMVRDCAKGRAARLKKDPGATATITKLPVGKLGSGMRYRLMEPRNSDDPTMVVDMVIIRVENTLIALEYSCFYTEYDPDLTRSAAKTATAKLQKALKQ